MLHLLNLTVEENYSYSFWNIQKPDFPIANASRQMQSLFHTFK